MKFFKTFLAALLAFFVGSFLFAMMTVLFIASIVALAGMGSGTTEVKQNSILKIDLSERYTDAPVSPVLNDFDILGGSFRRSYSLMSVLGAIEKAATDKRIAGIYVCGVESPNMDMAQASEIRRALAAFSDSGKFVISYGSQYSQSGYYVSSVADQVLLNPKGLLMWHGMAARVLFFKGLLDKLEVRTEVIRHGNFKAAVEPFILDKMSPENAAQMNLLVGDIWGSLLSDISVSRGIDSVALQNYASGLAITSPKVAAEKGFVDALMYQDEVDATLNAYVEEQQGASYGANDDPRFVALNNYIAHRGASTSGSVSHNKVAVLYADGEIVDGKGDRPGQVFGDSFAATVRELRRDDNVKAVVLRVNSPGGSALASEVISREMDLLRDEKPLIVSFGGTAASGGYYIASPADIIFTEAVTVTGSIGVFSLMLDVEKGLRNKLGITVDVALSNPSADLMTPFRQLRPNEVAYMRMQVEEIYDTFLARVAAGRNLPLTKAEAIAEGRVWSGVAAVGNGLADGVGGLKDAIALAADRADVANDFVIYEVTPTRGSFTQLLSLLSQSDGSYEQSVAALMSRYGRMLANLMQPGVQARMPYVIEME